MSSAGRPLRIGFQIWAQNVSWPELMSAASSIEARGFDSLWSNDHFFPIAGYQLDVNESLEGPTFEGWMVLSGLVACTSTIRVGCMVSGAGYRNPGLLVKMASTLDHASAGRLVLGIGAGWYERDHAAFGFLHPDVGERIDRLEESVTAIRRLLDGEIVTMKGNWVRMVDARNDPPPIQKRLPLLVGGSGERRTLPVVARYADWWNGEGTPEDIARKNALIDRLCRIAGRRPDDIVRTVGLAPPVIRSTAAEAVEVSVDVLVRHGMPTPDARVAAADSPSVGTSDQVAAHLIRYADAGAREVVFDWPTPYDTETLDALAILRRELG